MASAGRISLGTWNEGAARLSRDASFQLAPQGVGESVGWGVGREGCGDKCGMGGGSGECGDVEAQSVIRCGDGGGYVAGAAEIVGVGKVA
jgi:hypothetical protein